MSKSVQNIVDFAQAQAETISFSPDADKVLSGNPAQTVTNLYDDDSGVFSTGFWTGEPGVHKVSYSEEEFCHLLAGEVKISDDAGQSKTFKAGDSFVIPAGFSGTWETIAPARKIYVVFEKG